MEQNLAVLEEVCRNAVRLLRDVPGEARRVRLRLGDAAVDIEWASDPVPRRPVAMTEPGESENHAAEWAPVEPRPSAAASSGTSLDAAFPPHAGDAVTWIRAPMIGTFYHAPAPGEPPFVQEGDLVEAGTQVGILEAMKLMNSVEAECAGRVAKVLVADGTPVEYDQPLIMLYRVDDAAGQE